VAKQTLMCPECGKIGNVSTQAVAPGVAVFDIMLGLDPFECAGCRETLTIEASLLSRGSFDAPRPGPRPSRTNGDRCWS
jgi:hypothetical protein